MAAAALNLKNIQGDIIFGLPKRQQIFLFFQIRKPVEFRQRFGQHLLPLITTSTQVLEDHKAIEDHKKRHLPGLVPLTGTNVAFSSAGLIKLGITDKLDQPPADPPNSKLGPFTAGQFADAQFLGDPGRKVPTTSDANHYEPAWRNEFKQSIHGVFLITADNWDRAEARSDFIERAFQIDDANKASIVEVLRIRGQVRPKPNKGHEHFGFDDGISNPVVKGLENLQKAPTSPMLPIDPGVLLLGQPGDPELPTRPAWAKDGSFLAFRQLDQFVPEFDQFLDSQADNVNVPGHPELTHEQKKELLGARLVGRWKSGAPVDLAPVFDNPGIVQDPSKVNNFSFLPGIESQIRCPFHAHVRKTMPRGDLAVLKDPDDAPTPDFSILNRFRIMRAGIPYGPEVSDSERENRKTESVRGLAFACYQSQLANGFRFIQHSWADKEDFPPKPTSNPAGVVSGLDPIIGQHNVDPEALAIDATKDDFDDIGSFPGEETKHLTIPQQFVLPRGGEYFFSPSLEALGSNKFSLPPPIVPDSGGHQHHF